MSENKVTIKKSDLVLVGHFKGVTQYENKEDAVDFIFEVNNEFFLNKNIKTAGDTVHAIFEFQDHHGDKKYLGTKIDIQ